ncbi:MAG: hypothetical protein KC464_27640 [Myxococcales bacterium]|nr:hypothetical protein [Myxococcales bacterium]
MKPPILVRAAAGRLVAFPRRVLAGPGGVGRRLHGAGVLAPDHEGDAPELVPDHSFVRGRIRAGDLERMAAPAAAAPRGPARNTSAAKGPDASLAAPVHTARFDTSDQE